MALLSLHSVPEVQMLLAQRVRARRRALSWSRRELAERSSVPESTIKKFETTGQISLRQFLLLWMCVDQLESIVAATKDVKPAPRSIEDVLRQ